MKRSVWCVALGLLLVGMLAASEPSPEVAASVAPTLVSRVDLAKGVTLITERDPGAKLSRVTMIANLSDVRLRAVKGGDALFALETVPRVFARTEGGIVAVNADFFEVDHSPTGIFVTEAGIWRGPWLGVWLTTGWHNGGRARAYRGVLAWDDAGHVFLGEPTVSMRLVGLSSESLPVDVVNVAQKVEINAVPPQVTVFNHLLGKEAPAPEADESAAVIRLEGGPWLPNRAVKGAVVSTDGRGAVAMDANTVVVHVKGGLPTWLTEGSVVRLVANIEELPGTVTGVLGGLPMLVHEGKNVALARAEREGFPMTVATSKQPRTAVGLRKDGSELVLVVWDGRHAERTGASLEELAEYMISLGCREAMNFDGGGSSAMVAEGRVVNQPSDVKEDGLLREVGNVLVVIGN